MKMWVDQYSEGVIYAWTELLINTKFGPEELPMLYTANTTVEECAEWVAPTWHLNPLLP